MATISLTDAHITIAGTDLSDHIAKVTINAKCDELDNTAFGATAHGRQGGLKDGSCALDFNQDYAASKVDATLWPLLGTVVAVTVRPTSSAISATNPEYQVSVLVADYSPVDGAVGDLNKTSVTWNTSGAMTRAVS